MKKSLRNIRCDTPLATAMTALGMASMFMPSAQAQYTNGAGTAAGNSIAIGASSDPSRQASASGEGSIAIGSGARTVGDGSVAIGLTASANGGPPDVNSIAIGTRSESFGQSLAIGTNAVADQRGYAAADGAIAIGTNARTGAGTSSGLAVGNGARIMSNAVAGTAIGVGATVSSDRALAIGTGAQASAANAISLGAGSSVTQAGGVALGSGSVASRAAGVAGYVPPGASQSQRVAIGASTGTLAAISVGDPANGQFRQITGLAAGSADSDAVNVSQLRGVQSTMVKYDTNADGSANYNSVTLGGGNAPGTVAVHNVAPGVAGTDAVNVNQLNVGLAGANAYTDARLNGLQHSIDGVARKAYAGVAAALALESAPHVPGKTTYAAGTGYYRNQGAVGVALRRTSDSGRWSVTGGVAASAGGVAARLGVSGVWD